MITRKNKKYAIKTLLAIGRIHGGNMGFKTACVCIGALGVEAELILEAMQDRVGEYDHNEQMAELVREVEENQVFEQIAKRMEDSTKYKN